VVVQETYLPPIIRWVHQNPIRKHLCGLENADRYRWSGHSALSSDSSDEIVDCENALKLYPGPDRSATYLHHFSTPTSQEDQNLISWVKHANEGRYNSTRAQSWVIGDPDFTSRAFLEDRCGKVRVARHIRENIPLEKLHIGVCSVMRISPDALLSPRRPSAASAAREVFAFIAHSRYDFTMKQIAQHLNLSSSSCSKLIRQGEAFCEGTAFLKTLCDQIAQTVA